MPTPITVNVNFIDLTGNPIQGYMQASIVSPTGAYDLYVTGTGIILPKIVTSSVGTSVSVQIWGNDVVVDASDNAKDTYYTVNLFNASNALLWSASYLFTGAGPINLVGFPILNPVPPPPTVSNPIVTSPGGNNGDVQFNNGGFFGGVDVFAWQSSNSELLVGSIIGLDSGTFSLITPQPATSRFASIINGSVGNQYAIMAVGQATNSTVSSGVYTTTLAEGNADCNMFAVEADAYSAPSIATTQTFNGAILTYAANKGPGTVTKMFSFLGETDCLGGTTTTNMAFWAVSAANSGTMHNNFGFHSDNQGAAGDTLSAAFHADAQTGSGFGFYSVSAPNFFGGTSATNALQITNLTTATGGANQSSPNFQISGTFWNGAASVVDKWTIQNAIGTGTNPNVNLNVTHSGSSGSPLFNLGNIALTCGDLHAANIFFGGNAILTTAPATGGGNVNSTSFELQSSWWDGAAAHTSTTSIQDTEGVGTNPTDTTTISNSGAFAWAGVSIQGPLQFLNSTSGSSAYIQSKTFTLSAAQIKTLHSVPTQVLPAPGANKTYVIVGTLAHYRHNTTAFTLNGSTQMMLIFNNTAAANPWFLASNAGFLDQATDRFNTGGSFDTDISTANAVNTALYASTDVADPTLGDGTVTLSIQYTIVDVTVS